MPRRKTIDDDKVLDGAARVMFSTGPDFTLSEVAAETGLAPATLLQRFGTKHDLVVRVIERENARFEAMLKTRPKAKGAKHVVDLVGELSKIFDEDDQGDEFLWLREDIRDPDLNVLARARFKLTHDAVAARMPDMKIARPDATRLLLAVWHGAVVQWSFERKGRLTTYVKRSVILWFLACGVKV